MISAARNTAPNKLPPIVLEMWCASDSELPKVPPGETSVTK